MITKLVIIVIIAIYAEAVPAPGNDGTPAEPAANVSVPPFIASTMKTNCEADIKAITSYVHGKPATVGHLLDPIATEFRKIVDQLSGAKVASIGRGQSHVQTPHAHSNSSFAPLDMVEMCAEHIAAIKSHMEDDPKSVQHLEPIVKNFEAIVEKLGQQNVKLMVKIDAPRIPVILKQVSVECTAAHGELTIKETQDLILRVDPNYNKAARAKKFLQGDMVLLKSIQRLNYVLADVQANTNAVRNAEGVSEGITNIIASLTGLRDDLKGFIVPPSRFSLKGMLPVEVRRGFVVGAIDKFNTAAIEIGVILQMLQ